MEFSLFWHFLTVCGFVQVACQGFLVREPCVDVLKIRAMFENHALGVLEDGELELGMRAIREAESFFGKEKKAFALNI